MARDQVFISYSRKDKDWLERLQTMLVPLTRAGFKIWADTDIKPGEEWKKVIEQALTRTKVAVLLISPDFLASRFIHENELPPLLDAAKNAGLTILWVLVRPCYYKPTAIAKYQAALSPPLPLSKMDYASQEEALVSIAEKIEEALLATPMIPVDSAEKTASVATAPRPAEAAIVPPPRSLPAIQNIHGYPPKAGQSDPGSAGVLVGTLRSALQKVSRLKWIPNIHGWPAQKVQELQRQTDLALGLTVEFRDTLKDSSQGPEMVVIPAGRFLMGSPENKPGRSSDEGPQHRVMIASPFVVGRYAVTFEEYDCFCEATKQKKPGDEGWGRSRRPVINVTWYDAIAYCAWLSLETGATYRLPSEAEWEYAARAGTTTAFWWGNDIDTTRANYDGNYVYRNGPKGEYRHQTVPVDTFQPNPFGLYQVHGNVWEWVQDSWHENYDGAPVDGAAWVEKSDSPWSWCVLRGGSWLYGPGELRGAARHRNLPHYRHSSWGFRLARTFP